LIHSTKKSMKEYGEQLAADEKANIEKALKKPKKSSRATTKTLLMQGRSTFYRCA